MTRRESGAQQGQPDDILGRRRQRWVEVVDGAALEIERPDGTVGDLVKLQAGHSLAVEVVELRKDSHADTSLILVMSSGSFSRQPVSKNSGSAPVRRLYASLTASRMSG